MTRSPDRAEQLNALGATGVVCDVYDAERLREVVAAATPEVVITEPTDLPQVMDRSRLAEFCANNDRLRTVGGDNLVEAALQVGVNRIAIQSIALIHAPGGDGLKTEETPVYLPPADRPTSASAMAHAEKAVLDCRGLKGTVLRCGYFDGPNTYYRTIEGAARQVPPIGLYCFIHVDDAAAGTVLALDAPPVSTTWWTIPGGPDAVHRCPTRSSGGRRVGNRAIQRCLPTG